MNMKECKRKGIPPGTRSIDIQMYIDRYRYVIYFYMHP